MPIGVPLAARADAGPSGTPPPNGRDGIPLPRPRMGVDPPAWPGVAESVYDGIGDGPTIESYYMLTVLQSFDTPPFNSTHLHTTPHVLNAASSI